MTLMAMTNDYDPDARSQRRAEGRARLQRLAEEGMPERTKEQAELDRLREYLLMWSQRQRLQTEKQGAPGSASFAPDMSNATSASEFYERSDNWAMVVIDTSIDDLIDLPDGMLMRGALRARYLNEGVSREAGMEIRVFRNRRLESMSLMEADALADRAEQLLIPIVKRRGLPL